MEDIEESYERELAEWHLLNDKRTPYLHNLIMKCKAEADRKYPIKNTPEEMKDVLSALNDANYETMKIKNKIMDVLTGQLHIGTYYGPNREYDNVPVKNFTESGANRKCKTMVKDVEEMWEKYKTIVYLMTEYQKMQRDHEEMKAKHEKFYKDLYVKGLRIFLLSR